MATTSSQTPSSSPSPPSPLSTPTTNPNINPSQPSSTQLLKQLNDLTTAIHAFFTSYALQNAIASYTPPTLQLACWNLLAVMRARDVGVGELILGVFEAGAFACGSIVDSTVERNEEGGGEGGESLKGVIEDGGGEEGKMEMGRERREALICLDALMKEMCVRAVRRFEEREAYRLLVFIVGREDEGRMRRALEEVEREEEEEEEEKERRRKLKLLSLTRERGDEDDDTAIALEELPLRVDLEMMSEENISLQL